MPTQQSTTTQPSGTPPEGGRWTWDGAQWVRLPDSETPAKLSEE
jgi:hypothetical protein